MVLAARRSFQARHAEPCVHRRQRVARAHGSLERTKQMRDAVRVVAHELTSARQHREALAALGEHATHAQHPPRAIERLVDAAVVPHDAAFSSTSASRISAMRSSSVARGMKSRSKLWIAAHASGTGVTGTSAPMRDITLSQSACTRASRSGFASVEQLGVRVEPVRERHRRADDRPRRGRTASSGASTSRATFHQR